MHTLLVILHVLGATIWTGGHLILTIGFLPVWLRERDPRVILDFESRFERIGIPALVIQIITGVIFVLPYLPAPDTPIDAHAVGSLGVKFILLLLTIGLAMHARIRIIPRLTPERLALAVHIIAVTIIAVLFVVLGVSIQLAS